MSRKQQRGEATVERVLDTALDLYAREGEAGLTVSALTRASGVSTGSVYHHFGNLHGVIAALAMRWLGRLLGELATALTAHQDARSGIEAVVRAYLEFVRTQPAAARLLHSPFADQEGTARASEIRDNQEARLTPIEHWLDGHRRSGELADLPTPVIETLVLGPVIGMARRWLTLGDVDLEEAARILPDRIWRSVGP
ncbi:TetR/AcrR family transcriptional regulator [Streptomyces omiyaensis]|uniref:TetR/AcrR family transcriptional regulator n=1 Tax=Streptomyces omiyaensis TaxID=68247 RepID=A0ABW7C2C8_9ACTN|nr:TetR/AcrR family transcriptional regulator [Streptomyces omiyaensis]GGY55449.1 TetR family transcriptional regulator [Streptomyces omiyaensis]